MKLSSNQLEAFYEAAKVLNFSQAARNLHVTQSALSQRIINLEEHLGAALFLRESAGLRLTEQGLLLLRHCQIQASLEDQLLGALKDPAGKELSGNLRIGGYSSLIWSVIVPALSEFLRANSHVHLEFVAREIHELPILLRNGAIDFAILDYKSERHDIDSHFLGNEENVLVEPKIASRRQDQYLDHDVDDTVTLRFLNRHGQKKTKVERSFLDDIYGIMAGVSSGLGSAVIPRHLTKLCPNSRIVEKYKPLAFPVYVHYYSQPYYSKLHELTLATLLKNVGKILESST